MPRLKRKLERKIYGRGQSIIAAIQLFNSNSKTSLTSGAQLFYPLHITVVNFIEGAFRQYPAEKWIMPVNLPLSYEVNSDHDQSCNDYIVHNKQSSVENLETLKECQEYARAELVSSSFLGFSAFSSCGTNFKLTVC